MDTKIVECVEIQDSDNENSPTEENVDKKFEDIELNDFNDAINNIISVLEDTKRKELDTVIEEDICCPYCSCSIENDKITDMDIDVEEEMLTRPDCSSTIHDSNDKNSATDLEVDIKSEDIELNTDFNDPINNISVLENTEPKQFETVIKEEICSIENDTPTDMDLVVEEETLTRPDWSATIYNNDDKYSATKLKIDIKSEDIELNTDFNDPINNISVLENTDPKQFETVIKEEICSIENDTPTDMDLVVEKETLTNTDWSATIAECIDNVSKSKMFVYTKRLDDMNIKVTKKFSFKKIIESMEFESKPKFKRLTNNKSIHPTVEKVLDFSRLQDKIRILNIKSRIYQLRAYRMKKLALDLCQPLSITLFDYKKFPKLTNLSGIELHNEINKITVTLLEKTRALNVLKDIKQVKQHLEDDVQGDTAEPKIEKTISLIDTKNCRIENYHISVNGDVISEEHLDLPHDTDWEVLKLLNSTHEVCCWYRRETVLKKLVDQTFIFQVHRLCRSHDCPIGGCVCCDKCKNLSKHTENSIEISDSISPVSLNSPQQSISTVFRSTNCEPVQKNLSTSKLRDLLNKPSKLPKYSELAQQALNTLKPSHLPNKPSILPNSGIAQEALINLKPSHLPNNPSILPNSGIAQQALNTLKPSHLPNKPTSIPIHSAPSHSHRGNLIGRALKFSGSSQLVKTNRKILSGNIAHDTNVLLEKEKNYMSDIIIVIEHSLFKDKKPFEEIYDIGIDGEIVLYHIKEMKNYDSTYMLSDKFDSSKKFLSFRICCWINREKIVNELVSNKLSHDAAKYIRRNHTCPNGKCICCCIRIKKFINEITNTHATEIKTPDLELNIKTNIIKRKSQTKLNPITEILKSNYINKTVTAKDNPFKSKISQTILSTQIFNNTKAIERNTKLPKNSNGTDDDSQKKWTKWDIQLIVNCLLKDMLYKLMKIEVIINDEGKVLFKMNDMFKQLSTMEDSFLNYILVQMQNIVDWLRASPDKNINDIYLTSTVPQKNTLQSENSISKSFETITTDITTNASPPFSNEGILKSVDTCLPQDNFITSMKPKLNMSNTLKTKMVDSSKEINILSESLYTCYYNTTPGTSKTSLRNKNINDIDLTSTVPQKNTLQSENSTSKPNKTTTTDLTANASPIFNNEKMLKSINTSLPQDNCMTSMKPKWNMSKGVNTEMSGSSKEIKALSVPLLCYYNTTPSTSKTSERNQNNTQINKNGSGVLSNMDMSQSHESQHSINNKVQLLTTSNKETLLTESVHSATSMNSFGATIPTNYYIASNSSYSILLPPNHSTYMHSISAPLTHGVNHNLHLPPPQNVQNTSTFKTAVIPVQPVDDLKNKIESYKRKFLEDVNESVLKKKK